MIDGAILIGSEALQSETRFSAIDPATGAALEPSFSVAGADAVARAASLAETAFPAYSATDPQSRAAFLEACAEAILAIGDELIVRAMAETGLPRARLEGERGRTVVLQRREADESSFRSVGSDRTDRRGRWEVGTTPVVGATYRAVVRRTVAGSLSCRSSTSKVAVARASGVTLDVVDGLVVGEVDAVPDVCVNGRAVTLLRRTVYGSGYATVDTATSADDGLWSTTDGERVLVSPDLHARLSGREDGAELVAVVEMPEDGVSRLEESARPHGPIVVFDRPTSPGNIGTLARSADAFGASALVVTGHAADPYDPQAVRASTGSLFALTVLRVPGPGPVIEHAHAHGYRIVGTDEEGSALADVDLSGRVVIVIGNETHGLSSGWRTVCDDVASIPMVGTASSLNAAVAGSIVLHESLRQRG